MSQTSINAAIADAVVQLLNDAPAQAIIGTAAARVWLTLYNLSDLASLRIKVYAAEDTQTAIARDASQHEHLIQIAIQKQLSTAADPSSGEDNTEIDALVAIAEYIASLWMPEDGSAFTVPAVNATVTGVTHSPICDRATLYKDRVFTSIVHVTFSRL